MSGKDKSTEIESTFMVAWHRHGMGTDYKWGTKDGFLWGDRNVLKLDYGYCAKTL